MAGAGPWLLIGNSRWHWAEGPDHGRRYWSESPRRALPQQPERWAAVGPLPAGLDPSTRITLAQIPLAAAPQWLGVDRALAGWQAWQRSGGPVLVADAGTALSLTWIDRQGRFAGGRLLAGAALQLRALHAGTQALPLLLPAPLDGGDQGWPLQTDAAMAVGVLDGLAGALQRAAAHLAQQQPGLQLWLTGGDGEQLHRLLESGRDQGQRWTLAPGLCLDGVAGAAALS
jgi:type III pantothenate kinase